MYLFSYNSKEQTCFFRIQTIFINNIITPTVRYGTEIFGMSEKRIQNIKRVIDTSLSVILNTKNFCRNKEYQEFDWKTK